MAHDVRHGLGRDPPQGDLDRRCQLAVFLPRVHPFEGTYQITGGTAADAPERSQARAQAHEILEPTRKDDPAPEPAAFQAGVPFADADAFDYQADGVWMAGTNDDERARVSSLAMSVGVATGPGDLQALELAGDGQAEPLHVVAEVVALFQILVGKPLEELTQEGRDLLC